MTAKSKANGFVRKFKSSALGSMNIVERKTTVRGKYGKGYYAVIFTLPPRPTKILRSMREYINATGGTNLDLSKDTTLRGIGTVYTAFFIDR